MCFDVRAHLWLRNCCSLRLQLIRFDLKLGWQIMSSQFLRSNNQIYAQVIDDVAGKTLASASTQQAGVVSGGTGNIAAAAEVGKTIGERAKAAGVESVVFDRGGYAYHGRIAALADAAREAGLEF